MALLGNIAVADRASMFPSGAAFLLSDKSKLSETLLINNGVVVEVADDVNYVVARLPTNHAVSEIFGLASEYVQQALDLLSVTGKADLTIPNATDEHIIWWQEGDKQIIRTITTSTLNVDVPPVKIVVHDEHGNEVQGVAVEPTYHHAYRYFRLSQVTEDLYDAYRNMYLAFELLLSSKYPKGKGKEIDWLIRGLTDAETALNLPAYLPTPSSTPIQDIIQTIYYNARLPLFHAKDGKPFYPPQSSQHRQAVAEALHLLTRIVLKMNKAWYNARYAGGAVSSPGL